MEKSETEDSLIYSNENIEKEQDFNKLVKELSELFKEVDELLLRTIILAANGDIILAYNSLIFYTGGWEIYKQERLPLGIGVRALMYGKYLEGEYIKSQKDHQNGTNSIVKQNERINKTKESVKLLLNQQQTFQNSSPFSRKETRYFRTNEPKGKGYF